MSLRSLFIFLPLLLLSLTLTAPELRGEVLLRGSSQSLFLFRENYPGRGNQGSVHNFRFYESIRMRLVNRGIKNTLSFHTFFQGSRDFNVNYGEDPLYRIYNGYLEWKNGPVSAAVGRQWLHLGVGSMTLDGAKVRYADKLRHFDLTGYLGTESPYSRHFSLAGWERSRAGGVYLSTKAVPGLKLGAGFTQKHRKGALALREAGLNAKADLPGGVQLSGRLNVNLLSDKVQKGILRTRYTGLKKWIFMAEYKHYRPRLFYQSYFWRFNPRANNQVRGGATYFLRPELTLTAAVSSIFFEDEKNSYLSLGLCCPFGSATLYRGDGYGGDEFGFAAGADYPLNKRLELFTVLNYSRYRWYEEEDRDYFFSSIFGLNWRPRHHTLASLELQNLNSELISKDWRLLVKLSFNGKYIF